MDSDYIAKRKPGRQRDPNAKSESLERVRRFKDRKHLELKSAEVMAQVVGERVRATMPKTMPQEIVEITAEAAEKASMLISEKGPQLVANLIKMAENGDMNAYQLLAKSILPPPNTRVKLPKNRSLNELTDAVLQEVAAGRMSVETGEKVLGLASKAADVAVSGSLVARLNKLNEQIQSAKENRQLPGNIESISHRIISIEAVE